jgi:hypothetical protein
MPGVGVRTEARLLTEVAGEHFESAGQLAAYAGLAPVTRRSGSSIRGEHPSWRGNKILKRAMFLSSFAAVRDPISRTYYDRKIAQGKRHNQALITLARRRCDMLFAMLRDGTLYQADYAVAACRTTWGHPLAGVLTVGAYRAKHGHGPHPDRNQPASWRRGPTESLWQRSDAHYAGQPPRRRIRITAGSYGWTSGNVRPI